MSLQPGGFAHMSVQWKDASQTGGPKCVDISGMNVFLSFRSPQSRGSVSIAFPPPAPLVCTAAIYSSLITGRDPYSSAADAARLAAIKVSMPKDAYYPGEDVYPRVTMPVNEPLPLRNRCPQLFMLVRDSTGLTSYRPVGGPNDYSCKIVTAERGEATLRVKLQLWNDKDLSERWLQFFQYTSMDTGPGSWKLLAQSPPVEYRVADPAKIVRTWGPEVKGLALDVTLDKTTFAVGEDVAAHVAFRNISAAEPMIEPRDNRIDIVIQDAGGQRVYPQTGDGYPAFFSGPGVVPTIAPGSTITAEMNVWLLGVPPGTYAVLGRWEAYVVNCAPGLVCVDPAGAPPEPYAVVTSKPTTIHVVPAGTSTPPSATKR